MTALVGYLLLFTFVAAFFVFFHLVLGRVVRPVKPDPEKLTIYECGEPTIGSAWIQFDLRFYVVALLFVIFDVEVAFFFPWAVVFGKVNALARTDLPEQQRTVLTEELDANARGASLPVNPVGQAAAAYRFAWIAFVDILVFFGVLLVGFAYLWKRGDLDWVRSTAAERAAAGLPEHAVPAIGPGPFVGAGSGS
jgi:NADH-quinone oxidoreductase subunit A